MQRKVLNKPIREVKGSKEYKVYVRNPKTGRVNTVRFGDASSRLGVNNPKRRKSYCSRSKPLSRPGDKLSPNYWSRKRWKCK